MSQKSKPQGSFISYMSNRVKMHGGINLAQGIPGFSPPKELLDALNAITYDEIHQYAPGTGNAKLKQALVAKYTDYEFKQDDFLIVNGATEACSLIYTYLSKMFKSNFTTLAFSPVYETYLHLPRIFNNPFVSFEFKKDGSIDFDRLEKVIVDEEVKLIYVNSPGNPYGKIWTKAEFEAIIKLSRKYSFYIVFDAVYDELYFTEKPASPLPDFAENIFYVNSFSKKLSITGWRIGYLVAHQKHMIAIQDVHDYTGLCTPSILQQAVADYYAENNFAQGYINSLREILKENFQKLKQCLLDLNFEIPETAGGYFIWAALPQTHKDGFYFAEELYEKEKIAVIAGEHFSPKHKNYIRFNIARETTEIQNAIKGLNDFFK